MIDWKDISHRIADLHRVKGESLLPLGDVGEGKNWLVSMGPVLMVPGRVLEPKRDIRRWLFSVRGLALVRRRDDSLVWTWFSEEGAASLMGLCRAMEKERALRWRQRDPDRYGVKEIAA